MKLFYLLFLFPLIGSGQTKTINYQQNVVINRDKWGIPHIEGKTDADAVFGLMYAQCEDDFARIELNFIEKLGRLSEINGEKDLYNDLLIKLLINETDAKNEYKKAEPWLKKLLDAHAAGINYYLSKHPEVKPKLLKHFEPWYALLWTDGSIGAISTANISAADLKALYEKTPKIGSLPKPDEYQQTGSNGFAIAPFLNQNGNAMLYINPHTTFYFRPEVHIKSNEGLNAYGAVTWGQFFVYQGFNEYCGWMHTSSNADVADTYIEKITTISDKKYYEINGQNKPVITKNIIIKYLENGKLVNRNFETYWVANRPIMAVRDGKWISLASYNRAEKSLKQSWLRTKAKGFEEYKKIMDLKANTSNNTVFADKYGNIAYWHGNFMPIRNRKLNWGISQDGSKTANQWQGLHAVNEAVHVYNPKNGWIQNCNSTPYTATDSSSPKRSDYPNYMAPDGENFRGINAARVLKNAKNLDLDGLIKLGYDNYLPAFEVLIPAFINKTQKSENTDIQKVRKILSTWDYRTTAESVATTLAIEWAQKLPKIKKVYIEDGEIDQVTATKIFAANALELEFIVPMLEVIEKLKKNFGSFEIAWGDINRYQRLNGNPISEYNDEAPSLASGLASGLWGCLPSYNSKYYENSKKRYGFNGNSFVCVVEFGKKVRAKSLLAGGESGNKNSLHFNDQAEMFVKGQFKDVLFYKEDIIKNLERSYHPGE